MNKLKLISLLLVFLMIAAGAGVLAANYWPVHNYSPTGSEDKNHLGWTVYRNKKYGYEIKYPAQYPPGDKDGREMELFPTGPESKRDGSGIRICLKNFSALWHIIDLYVYPKKSLSQLLKERNIPQTIRPDNKEKIYGDTVVTMSDIVIRGNRVRKIQYRFKENSQVSANMYFMDGAIFDVIPGPFKECAGFEKVSEEIIATFRFYK